MALNSDLVLACFAAILRMQLTRALALDFQRIASQVLQAAFPVLVEPTVEHQSYKTLVALDTTLDTTLASLLQELWNFGAKTLSHQPVRRAGAYSILCTRP